VVYRLSLHLRVFAYRCGGSTGYPLIIQLRKTPVSRLTLVDSLPRAPKNETSIYNIAMSELTNNSHTRLQDSLVRLEGKTKALLAAVEQTHKERLALEDKIEDAQNRIQNILNKLPSPGDTGQLDLLASAPEGDK
jgi:hypothetical protein